MNALHNRYAFEDVLRQSELANALKLRNVDEALADLGTRRTNFAARATTIAVLAGLVIVSAAIFVAGYSALLSDTPAVWIHRLMALTLAQSILIGAIAMKVLPMIEGKGLSVRIAFPDSARRQPLLERKQIAPEQSAPLPPPAPRPPFIGGKLAGREYMEFDDGTIEIDTLIGRRRFISIDAAREFVGA